MPEEQQPPVPPRRDVDATAMRGLAHPLRVRLFDALISYGPATTTILAERFGESTASVSYHVRQLAKHEFVVEDTERGVGRERWWRAAPGGAKLDVQEMRGSPGTREGARMVLDEFQHIHAERLAYWVSVGARSESQDWVRASLHATSHLRLLPEELAELNRQLTAVTDEWRARTRDRVDRADDSGPEGARVVEVQLRAFPLPGAGDAMSAR